MALDAAKLTELCAYIRVQPGESVFLCGCNIAGQSPTAYEHSNLIDPNGAENCLVYKLVGYYERDSEGIVRYVKVPPALPPYKSGERLNTGD